MSDEIEFTPEQQALVDKLVGEARIKAREKTQTELQAQLKQQQEDAERQALAAQSEWKTLAEKEQARARELEPYKAKSEEYDNLVAGMLKDRIKALGDDAKKAVEALPGTLSDAEKLKWLETNQGLFAAKSDGVGTPRKTGARQNSDSVRLHTKIPIRL